jgi:hypothetical protein
MKALAHEIKLLSSMKDETSIQCTSRLQSINGRLSGKVLQLLCLEDLRMGNREDDRVINSPSSRVELHTHTALPVCVRSTAMLEFFWDHSQTPKVPPDYNKHLHTLEFPAPDIDLDDLLNNHASFSQIPIAVILERIQRGNILIQDLSKIFHVTAPDSCSLIIEFPLQNRMELEEKEMNYSSQFIKTILSENEIPSSSVAHALMFVDLLH